MSLTMSQQQMPDHEALARFKEFFGITAAEIESAYQEVDRIGTEIEEKEKQNRSTQKKIEEKRQQSIDLWESYGKNSYSEQQQLLESTTKDSEELEKEIDALEKKFAKVEGEIETLKVDLTKAEDTKENAPYEATKRHVANLTRRLKEVDLSMQDYVDENYKKNLRTALKPPLDVEKIAEAVTALTDRVGELCAPIELTKKQVEIKKRLSALGKQDFRNNRAISEISELFLTNESNIKVLNGEVHSRLTEAELELQVFADRIVSITSRLQTLGKTKALDLDDINFAEMNGEADRLTSEARMALGEEHLSALDVLESQIDESEQQNEKAEELRTTCGESYDSLSKARNDLEGILSRGELGDLTGKITQAGNLIKKLAFAEALQRLNEGEQLLDELNKRVHGQEQQRILREQREQEQRDRREQQRQAEQAPNVASLDAIGRGNLKRWLTKAGQLINLGLLDVERSEPEGLNNQSITIEVEVTLIPLNENDELRTRMFVVHYHPHADSFAKNPWGSPMHCKATKHAPSSHNEDIEGPIKWVANYVPTLRDIKNSFR